MHKNMVLVCGNTVHKTMYNVFIKLLTYTRYTQFSDKTFFIYRLFAFYTLQAFAVVHIKSVQFISVITNLYTLYTGPTITTTLINK